MPAGLTSMNEFELTSTGSNPKPGRSRRHPAQRPGALFAGVAALGLLGACGASTAAPSNPRPQDNGAAVAGAEPNSANGEGAAVRYTNSRFHYQVDGPGAMKEGANGSAAYVGGTERLEISVVVGQAAADPRGFAGSDAAGLPAAHPSFKVVNQPAAATISGVAVQKLVFSWTDGMNQVTSKPNDVVTVRYYIPKNSSTLAILTYSISANRYDPQGADDVATTFKWL